MEVLRVSQEGPSSKVAAGNKQKPETRWLDDEQVVAAAVPTQMKKVFKAAVAALSDGASNASRGGKNEKRKRTGSAKMAPMMERFLIKRQRRADVTS